MKIGSLNVRGLGSDAKKDDVAAFFTNNNLDFCCLQETKMGNFLEKDGRRIWKTKEVRWSAEGAVGRSGGILTCWDERKFACSSTWNLGRAVIVNGMWRETMEEICLINVYVPCNREEKSRLWDMLSLVVEQAARSHICIIGDFNSILDTGERVGSGWQVSSRERMEFKDFVENNKLIDVALQGRKYTWYKDNGMCKSRIDRALINEKWAEKWSETGLRGLPRTVSDHCAIILQTYQTDWGPKPFRFINAWMSNPQFLEVVQASWREGGIEGWGCFVFMEKLKRLKEALKIWNREHFGNMETKIRLLKEEIQLLDEKDDRDELAVEDAARRRLIAAQLLIQMNNRRSLLSQKARIRWLREGDVNSKMFHKAISLRRFTNNLMGLEIEGAWTEEPNRVKQAVREHYRSLFLKKDPKLVEMPEDLVETRLEDVDGEFLTRNFTE